MAPDESKEDRPERIGVLGGTFDPIHRGHLAMARAASAARDLDRVLVVPAASPPHKSTVAATPEERLEMVRLATRGEDRIEPCDIEIARGGPSYTVDTLEELRRRHPGAALSFIIGADSVGELPRWRDAPRILELAEILTVPRPGASARFTPELFPGVPPEILERCERNRLDVEPVAVASRDIRRAVARGEPIDDVVPPAVAAYIRAHRLYEPGADDPAR